MQAFKDNDELEAKFKSTALPTLEAIGDELDNFFSGAHEAYPLGDVLYTLSRDPMVGVILEETFRESFTAIHNLFTRPGTFEFYLEVLKTIWGDSADITFTVPAPGKLIITIEALDLELQTFLAREIVDNMYVYHTVVDHDGDTIVFQGTQGIKTQQEANILIYELAPAGVYTEIDLTILEEE